MDEADRAQAINEQHLADSLAKHANRPHRMGEVFYCLECGEAIPAARRKAVPGVEYCVGCQRDLERFGGFWP